VKTFILVGLCAIVLTGCGGSGGSMPMPMPTAAPTSASETPTPATPSPTRTQIPEECLVRDAPLVRAVAQRVREAPPLSGLVLLLHPETLAWTVDQEFPGLDPMGISFVDCEWGWMVGRAVVDEFNTVVQRIYRTTNGGSSWSEQSDNIDRTTFEGGYALAGVRCMTRDRCVAFGRRPVGPDTIVDAPPLILLTTDGGATWVAARILPAPNQTPGGNLRNGDIFRLCLTSSGIGLAAGYGVSGNLTLLTDDGGATWRDITAVTVGDVACSGAMGLWSVAEGLRRSTDGGVTWADVTAGLPESATQAEINVPPSFIDAQTGWLLARLPSRMVVVLRTIDGGDSWTELAQLPQVPETTFADHLVFATAALGVTSGRRTNDSPGYAAAAITQDGGATWAPSEFPSDVLYLTDLTLVP
jgi:photosystem II stability/assembly factor-like uncharacterized protein